MKDIIRNDHNRKIQQSLKIWKGKFTPIDYCMLRQECQAANVLKRIWRTENTPFVYMSHKEMTLLWVILGKKNSCLMQRAKAILIKVTSRSES